MIALFDIDGTLLETSESHRKSFSRAFEAFGIKKEMQVSFGLTDRQLLVKNLNEVPEEEVRRRFPELFRLMTEAYLKKPDIKLLPGVKQLLKALKDRGISMGLVTGNISGIGLAKVKLAGIADYFTFNAFGDEMDERSELLGLAMKRAEDSAVYFADTPFDSDAARAAGIPLIAVGTSGFSHKEMRADHYFKDFTRTEDVLRAFEHVST